MKNMSLIQISIFYVATLILCAAVLSILGCGGNSNPTTAEDSQTQPPKPSKLKVEIEAETNTMKAGEQVRLSAKLAGGQSNKIIFDWKVVDGNPGTFSNHADQTTIWTAPTSVGNGEMEVVIIQLTVTVISLETISDDSGELRIQKSIQTATQRIALTVTG